MIQQRETLVRQLGIKVLSETILIVEIRLQCHVSVFVGATEHVARRHSGSVEFVALEMVLGIARSLSFAVRNVGVIPIAPIQP